MAFVVELWESIFTPGTTPALLKATHASFILLILSLVSLIVLTKSIHFINLLVIAILFYITVIWFVNELQAEKLKTNEQLNDEQKQEEDKQQQQQQPNQPETKPAKVTNASTATTTSGSTTPRRRKV